MNNRAKRPLSWPILAIILIGAVMIAACAGYFIGHRQPEGVYAIRGGKDSSPYTPPPAKDTHTATSAPVAQTPDAEKININTASADELTRLPGIGPAIAARIVEFRELYGPFISAEDLLHVSGIGDKVLQNIIDLIEW